MVWHISPMSDSLHSRALLVMEENRRLREDKMRLDREYAERIEALRFAILESAMSRAESKARRDNRG
ncbi:MULTISPECIES: hypothetical protein [Bradyrhizobium]|jgi:hypothetical protein|uniref:hypothetical protein n=1 Tax=Bradyrhizobium TaxID=374 RepID=UPI0004157A07|nr:MULTISPECIES: hypothetical protein [Bradyrhizobium]UFW47207.1 hypothetical protein BaraCB756_33790 [Bradyrhizobium arachidis]SFU95514.1 hypothetical protein SAMN05192541_10891 [Bradyrhizobium arachidis]